MAGNHFSREPGDFTDFYSTGHFPAKIDRGVTSLTGSSLSLEDPEPIVYGYEEGP